MDQIAPLNEITLSHHINSYAYEKYVFSKIRISAHSSGDYEVHTLAPFPMHSVIKHCFKWLFTLGSRIWLLVSLSVCLNVECFLVQVSHYWPYLNMYVCPRACFCGDNARKLAVPCACSSCILKEKEVHTNTHTRHCFACKLTDTTTKYYEPGRKRWWEQRRNSQFCLRKLKEKEKVKGRGSIFMYWYCSYTDKRTENRVSRGCQKTESKQGRTAGEKGNRWTLSCHAEEFICVFYLVECGVVARRLRPRLWQPLRLPGGFEWHWFCFDCETVREIGDGLRMTILSYQDYCGISQWWELACLVTKG